MTDKKSTGQNVPKNESGKLAEISKEFKNIHIVKVDNGKPTPPPEKIKPTYEDLLKRLEELEKQRTKKPATIQEVINFFEEKKKKITHLELFKTIKAKLNDAFALIKPIADDQDFNKLEYVLTFGVYSSYSKGDEIFKISNPLVIEKCIEFLSLEIDKKTKMLEAEIQQDF